jgi:hypothetical protein
MKKLMLSMLLMSACAAFDASAQPMMPGPPPPPGGGVPSAEMLATVPGLTAAQQVEVRKILLQRRDAMDASQSKSRADFEALRKRDRDEHERIDAQFSDQLRKTLGDDGYRSYAQWSLMHGGPGGPGQHVPRGPHGDRPGGDGPKGPDGGPNGGPDGGPDGGAGKPDDE